MICEHAGSSEKWYQCYTGHAIQCAYAHTHKHTQITKISHVSVINYNCRANTNNSSCLQCMVLQRSVGSNHWCVTSTHESNTLDTILVIRQRIVYGHTDLRCKFINTFSKQLNPSDVKKYHITFHEKLFLWFYCRSICLIRGFQSVFAVPYINFYCVCHILHT